MIRRMVTELRTHAATARELSLGVVDVIAFLARGRSEIDHVFYSHHAAVVRDLPGF